MWFTYRSSYSVNWHICMFTHLYVNVYFFKKLKNIHRCMVKMFPFVTYCNQYLMYKKYYLWKMYENNGQILYLYEIYRRAIYIYVNVYFCEKSFYFWNILSITRIIRIVYYYVFYLIILPHVLSLFFSLSLSYSIYCNGPMSYYYYIFNLRCIYFCYRIKYILLISLCLILM